METINEINYLKFSITNFPITKEVFDKIHKNVDYVDGIIQSVDYKHGFFTPHRVTVVMLIPDYNAVKFSKLK